MMRIKQGKTYTVCFGKAVSCVLQLGISISFATRKPPAEMGYKETCHVILQLLLSVHISSNYGPVWTALQVVMADTLLGNSE